MIRYSPEEHDTDECAVDCLYKTGGHPESMGDFLYRLSGDEALPSIEKWISTHPDAKDRASEIWERVKTQKHAVPFRYPFLSWHTAVHSRKNRTFALFERKRSGR